VVLGDPDRLQQLVLILLDNALKYTPSGGTVSVALRTQDGWATISVHDTGIGMADKERERIFRRFYRSQAASGHYAEGSGLGLAIADQIVESHQGRIDVTSAPGQGSVFTIAFPIYHER
jgi:two-component system sensor histidine kinase CiaH